MANKTINDLTEATSAAAGDFLALWRAANADTRKISKSNFIGATLTGGGTISLGGFTFTIPATGTAALLAVAQTFTALKTFSAGLTFGQDTLNYYDEGTWTPTDTSGASLTFTNPTGQYTRIGRFVLCSFSLAYPSTANGSAASLGGLPFTPASVAGSAAGGGTFLAAGYTAATYFPLVQTTPAIIFLSHSSGAALTNANLSTIVLRHTVFFTV